MNSKTSETKKPTAHGYSVWLDEPKQAELSRECGEVDQVVVECGGIRVCIGTAELRNWLAWEVDGVEVISGG